MNLFRSRCATIGVVCLALLLALVFRAHADPYPVKPIKLVVSHTPGGAVDVIARHFGQLLAIKIGQPVVIENRPGASGAIGSKFVAAAPADGYTLLMCNSATHAGNVIMLPDLGYDPVKDFTPIVRLVTVPFILVISPRLPVNSVRDLVALAKAEPGKFRFGSGGNGSFNHIAGELFAHRAGIQVLHIPYKGLNEVMTDVMGGHIDMGFPTPGESLPLIKANRLRAMAITGLRRLPSLPDIPTFGEAGFPGTELLGWGGLCAPASTPAPIVSKLNELSLAVYLDPKVRPDLERQGYEVGSNTPSEFTAFIQQEITRVTRLAKELQIQPGR